MTFCAGFKVFLSTKFVYENHIPSEIWGTSSFQHSRIISDSLSCLEVAIGVPTKQGPPTMSNSQMLAGYPIIQLNPDITWRQMTPQVGLSPTRPLPPSNIPQRLAGRKPSCSEPELVTNQIPVTHFLGLVHLLEAHRTQRNILLSRLQVYYQRMWLRGR